MKYAGMPMGMWTLFAGSFRKDLTPAMCRLDYTMRPEPTWWACP